MQRVEIDLNLRVSRNLTVVAVEDTDPDTAVGDAVEVFESESGIYGPGRIHDIAANGLVYIDVEWADLRLPEN